MKDLDSIASKIAKGNAKANIVANNESKVARSLAETAAIDKVGPIEQNARGASEGLTGVSRSVAAEVKPVATQPSGFGQRVSNAITLINNYELKMGGTARTALNVIDDQQARLYNAIMMIIQSEVDSDFIGGMEFLFRKFREDKNGAFGSDRLRRRINYMRQPSGNKGMLAYSGFLDMIQIFCKPANRRAFWKRFNKSAMLQIVTNVNQRSRLENYMNSIAR